MKKKLMVVALLTIVPFSIFAKTISTNNQAEEKVIIGIVANSINSIVGEEDEEDDEEEDVIERSNIKATETESTTANQRSEMSEQQKTEPIDLTKRQAVVVTNTSLIYRGQKYIADIVMLNADPRCNYKTYINGTDGKELENNRYQKIAAASGQITYNGYVLETNKKGMTKKYPFTGTYYITEPYANIEVKGYDFLFAGYANDITIKVPGIAAKDIYISITNATTSKTDKGWKIRPLRVGTKCILSIYAFINGKKHFIANKEYNVLSLPTPVAALEITSGDSILYFTQGNIKKEDLLNLKKLTFQTPPITKEIIDTDLRYVCSGFDMKIFLKKGKVVELHSNSEEFTKEMRKEIEKLTPGSTFYITNIIVITQDKIKHKLNPFEVVVK